METPHSYKQSPPPIPPPYYEDDEITLKELILKIQEFWKEAWKNKGWIILAAALMAGLFLVKTWYEETTYTSSLTFLVSGNNSKSGSGDLAAALGYGTFNYELDKIVELARARRIINKILLKKVPIGNKTDFLANQMIVIYDFQEKWEEESKSDLYEEFQLKDFYFTNDNLSTFLAREHRALNLLNELVAGNSFRGVKGLMDATYDKKTEMVRLSVVTKEQDLSIQLIEAIFEELNDFYAQETVGRPRRTFELLKVRADSMLIELNQQERQLAKETDRNANLISRASSLSIGQLSRKVQTTNRIYEEILRNKEKIEFMLNNETPEFQVIDRTFIPLKDAPSRLKALLIGGFLGGFLGIGYVIGRKIIRDAME